ncbi:MAG: hypothetical protein ACI9O4_001366 [Chitinophagales bacterium]|jgi:hypothetical protein
MDQSNAVYIWWAFMSCIAALNLVLLYLSFKAYKKRLPAYSDLLAFVRTWHMRLAAIYVFGCGFRSILPRGDVRRIVLVDHWISAVAIGRSVATIAELSFAAQWAFILFEIGRSTQNKFALLASKVIVPLIIIAEIFSWYACTTGNYFGTIIEESLWAVCAGIFVIGMFKALKYYEKKQLMFIRLALISGLGYFTYMITVDVPSYIRGFISNQADGKVYSGVMEGIVEVATQWRLTHVYDDWKYEFVWMTLYFSLAVWGSMLIVNSPRLDKLKY